MNQLYYGKAHPAREQLIRTRPTSPARTTAPSQSTTSAQDPSAQSGSGRSLSGHLNIGDPEPRRRATQSPDFPNFKSYYLSIQVSPNELLHLWRSIEDPSFHVAENQLRPQSKPFTVLNGAQLRQATVPPKISILGDGAIALGQLTTLIGQGGTGKSRVAMQIAISQILGWTFAGMATHSEPLKHLLIGTENSIHRQKSEYLKMTSQLTPEQTTLVDTFLFFHVGDINKDADVRHTLREITKVCRRINQNTVIIIIHHGRTGRQNIAQAVGWDKGNFALGSKALYSGARSQINIAPAAADDPSRIIISCGKSNDAKPFDPVGLQLEEATMLYQVDSSFNLQTWKDDVEGKRSTANFTLSEVAQTIQSGAARVTEIHAELGGSEAGSRRSLERILAKGKKEGYFRTGKEGYKLTQNGDQIVSK